MSYSSPIHIAIAEDQILLRKAMAELLEMESDITIVYEANNGRELLRYLDQPAIQIDLVLTDLEMPEVGGLEVIRQLKERRPSLPVVVLSSHEEEATILTAIQSGAKGYLRKNAHPDEVLRVIRSVMEHGFYFNEEISKLLLRGLIDNTLPIARSEQKELLTKRESEVLVLICQELTNKEIAEQLHLSPRTVESYRKNMLEKVGAKNTVGLVIYAIKQGIINLKD